MKRLATRFLGLLLVPAAAAWCFTSEPQSGNALPSAGDYSATVLPERSDTLSWKMLGQVEPSNANGKLIPTFSKEILALDKKDVKVIGFMVPIEADAKHKHFVLSAVPLSCPFCMPAGPESMVEVRLKSGIDYDVNPIVVAGKFSVRNDDPRGVLYSLSEGVPVPTAPAR